MMVLAYFKRFGLVFVVLSITNMEFVWREAHPGALALLFISLERYVFF